MFVPSWLRTILFVPLFIFLGVLAWDYVDDTPVCPIRLVEPISLYIVQHYLTGEGLYSNARSIRDAVIISPDYGQLFLTTSASDTKKTQIYIILSLGSLIALAFLAIPTQVNSVIGNFIMILVTTAFVLNSIQVRNKQLEDLLWPVYLNFISAIVGMFAAIL
ncbi:hypothetical protein TVAG_332420 [Trichomonas vaginalis G3]|uniref:Uncharacterized protein n=1 Tax=Trichomonas vaginalis (strain ATCC PRA-98 / G3) TaxID=412133 RepID=A2FAB5_TRIV3|nr:hypothetical protein TVAGG3_0916650 [Trichomonas vaginalis G3]EAX98132.1 hypothetical protein TVAG_332420 [Trichomonas vaginalis G3]KAI5484848.1 hypothetical protein TVAGG3_0916650 [Trichomonas vaginalis G3]|eukprot:XP_001311062.1 hypothetical protein [Trichomonas vaginalis G3]